MPDNEYGFDEVARAKKAVLTDLEVWRLTCEEMPGGGSAAANVRGIQMRIRSVGPIVPDDPDDVFDSDVPIPPNDPDLFNTALRAKQSAVADLNVWLRVTEQSAAGDELLSTIQQSLAEVLSIPVIPPCNPDDD